MSEDFYNDEIVSIEKVNREDTIDIETDGDHLFYANGILTHNSSHDEVEFDHSHISGGLSKINTADNVIGIFTTMTMRENGRYQIQLMKTRSSSGVGQKVDLAFDNKSLKISDLDDRSQSNSSVVAGSLLDSLKNKSVVNTDTGEVEVGDDGDFKDKSSRLRNLLGKI